MRERGGISSYNKIGGNNYNENAIVRSRFNENYRERGKYRNKGSDHGISQKEKKKERHDEN